MSEFIAITTQEQLDSVIGDRLKRNEEKWAKKYEGFVSPDDVASQKQELEKQVADLTSALDGVNKKLSTVEKDIADRDAKIKGFEVSAMKHRIAHENGLSYDAIDFIQGNDEDEIKASAEKFKNLVGKSHSAPSFQNEPKLDDGKDSSVRKLAQSLATK